MKRLFIGIFAISIALVSCNKEEVIPVSNNNSYSSVKKTLVQQDYVLDGINGDLYKTKGGQFVIEVKTVIEKGVPSKPLNYDGYIYNDYWNKTRCITGGKTCTTIGGKDDETYIVVKV